ncbi:insulinase family protein [Acinetobacter towneri]|uniref:M16 family metallopeptidase n=1 Tax=Acinetobacter towneri TaxID=202956 RepID=UPI002DBCA915|nr:insulinase family protein [Acinetobacter towneri]MEB6564153.1 insulinase family protein [Acinetobacter towneri]
MLLRLKTLSLSLCVLAFNGVVFAQPVLVKSKQDIQEYQLDNGLRVILAPNQKENKVFMNMVYLTGSLNDPQGKGGLAHLLEHLAFKGTKNVPAEEFQRRLDQHSLMHNASTDYYSTKYTNIIRPETRAVNEMIFLEAERMDKLVLQEKYVPAEIAIVKREREVRMDQPFSVLLDQVWKSAYGNQYFGRLPIGDLNELQSIKMQELNQFYRTWYAPNNAVLVMTGKFDQTAVLKQIDQHFSPIAARQIPKQVQVPLLDSKKIQPRNFVVQKGSQLAKFNLYLNGKDEKLKTALVLSPYLHTLQPSGHLYQNLVETGTSTMVQSSTWLDQYFNLVLMGALYAPNHDAKQVQAGLNKSIEQAKNFDAAELQRVKNLIQNQSDSVMNDAVALGGRLSDYAVAYQGDWTQYWRDLQDIQQLNVDELNRHLKQFFTAEHRVIGDIQPTPEDQKQALTAKNNSSVAKTLDQQDAPVIPLKDVQSYQQEVAEYVQKSKQSLIKNEKKILRGSLKNGAKYALFPTATRDDKTYAAISVNLGTAQTLFKQGEILDLTAYLLLRASQEHSLQDIADQSIAAGGSAFAQADANSMHIQIVAKKEKFDEFFNFVLDVMQAPSFEQSQFDLIRSQSLSSLERPYTEPETVAALTMARLIEIYPKGDLRYHFEPEFAKQQLQAATQVQVQQLYRQFFAMDHAHIAITGEFDPKSMQKLLSKRLGQWRSHQPYQRLDSAYTAYPAQKLHVLAEQREFGSYQSLLTLPLGVNHPDTPAMMVLSYILGESQLSSRLAQELREKNALVYGFNSGLSLSEFEQSGALSISAQYSAGKSAQVSQAVHKVLMDLHRDGVTLQEVEAAKADILKKRVTALEDERSIHRMLVPQLEQGRDLLFRERRDQALAKLSKADVDAVIQKYLNLEHLLEVAADQYGQVQADMVTPKAAQK